MDKNRIDHVLAIHGLGTVLDVKPAQLTPTIGASATSETFYVQTDTAEILVKFADPQILAERTRYHREIALHLPLPQVIAAGDGYQILEWIPGAQPLLELVCKADPAALTHFRQAANYLVVLWSISPAQTQERSCSGHYKKNIKAGPKLTEYLADAYDLPIVINGDATGLTVRQIFEETLAILNTPVPRPSTTHGDLRLDNILVHPQRGVVFIDARPSFVDWVDDLALFAWQRGFRMLEFSDLPSLSRGPETLAINYSASWPQFVDDAEQEGLRIADWFARSRKDATWRHRYHAMVAACALREIVSIQRRRALGAIGRNLPADAEGFWIAEAVRNHKLVLTAHKEANP